jgi:L-threonylcarbamoyladenylate synthase
LEDTILKILSKKDVKEAALILKNNGLLAFPTETVYGLGVVASSYENYLKLVKVKNRHPDKPFTLMISKVEQVENYLEVDDLSRKIIKNLMPGPITLILKAKKGIPDYVDHGTGFVGIRMPDDKFVLKLIDEVNAPLFVPSCNKADQPPCKNTEEVKAVFDREIEGCIDGSCAGGVPSTIIKENCGEITLLRQGNLTLDEIKERIK